MTKDEALEKSKEISALAGKKFDCKINSFCSISKVEIVNRGEDNFDVLIILHLRLNNSEKNIYYDDFIRSCKAIN